MNIFATTVNQSPTGSDPDQATCECIWMCGRGATRLCCLIRRGAEGDFDLEVVRNGRLYGTYHFVERPAAVTFALRLRHSFEGNGWLAA